MPSCTPSTEAPPPNPASLPAVMVETKSGQSSEERRMGNEENWGDAFAQDGYIALGAALLIFLDCFVWSWAIKAESWTWANIGGILAGIAFISLWLWLRRKSIREYRLTIRLIAYMESGGPEVPGFLRSSKAMMERRMDDALPILGLLFLLLVLAAAVGGLVRLV